MESLGDSPAIFGPKLPPIDIGAVPLPLTYWRESERVEFVWFEENRSF